MLGIIFTVLILALIWWFITSQLSISEPFLTVLKVLIFVALIYVLASAFGYFTPIHRLVL